MSGMAGCCHMAGALHLTASMRVIEGHEGGRVTIEWAKRRVFEAAAARAGPVGLNGFCGMVGGT